MGTNSLQSRPLLAIALSASAIAVFVGVGHSAFAFESFYATRFSPGVFIGPLDASGRTKTEIRSILLDFERSLEQKGMLVSFQGSNVTLYPLPITLESDIPIDTVRPLAQLDIEGTIESAFAVGHTNKRVADILQYSSGFFTKQVFPITLDVDSAAISESIDNELSTFITTPVRPHFAYQNGVVDIVKGVAGQEFDHAQAMHDITAALQTLTLPSITMIRRDVLPTMQNDDLRALMPGVLPHLEALPTSFTHNEKQFPLEATDSIGWIGVRQNPDSTFALEYDSAAIRAYLSETIAPQVAIAAEAPHFIIEDGIIRADAGPVTGQELDIEETLKNILAGITTRTPSIALVTKQLPSPLMEVADGLAVHEVIASAETNFTGSPTNRRKNIALGMARINGLVVMPDEEFSLIKALGPIEKENGFLPELVIKGNKTTPEYGGGLCQVSTTLFRSVAHAGLPVLERRNHSYRVSYYEPPVGFDATIYFPKPDFRFKNDTGAPILILAHVKGTIAHVTLWGTKDGRTVEIDAPKVFNVKKAGAVKMIETATLKPGEKKCTEKAHNGADAIFERRVTQANGDRATDTFASHYVVWPAVCLIGKQPIEEVSEEKSTEASPVGEESVPEPTSTEAPSGESTPEQTNTSGVGSP